MGKVIYKREEGILHIGGGRFFHANEPVEVTEEEKVELLEKYEDLEEFVEQKDEDPEKEGKPKGRKAEK